LGFRWAPSAQCQPWRSGLRRSWVLIYR